MFIDTTAAQPIDPARALTEGVEAHVKYVVLPDGRVHPFGAELLPRDVVELEDETEAAIGVLDWARRQRWPTAHELYVGVLGALSPELADLDALVARLRVFGRPSSPSLVLRVSADAALETVVFAEQLAALTHVRICVTGVPLGGLAGRGRAAHLRRLAARGAIEVQAGELSDVTSDARRWPVFQRAMARLAEQSARVIVPASSLYQVLLLERLAIEQGRPVAVGGIYLEHLMRPEVIGFGDDDPTIPEMRWRR